MKKYALLFLFGIFICGSNMFAQPDTTAFRILKGIVLDDSLGYSLPFVHFWNESTRVGGISNEEGVFKIKVRGGDTLVFSSLGYFHKLVFINQYSDFEELTVRMEQKIYEIGEAVVKGYRSYESFKEEFLSLDPTDEKTDRLREYLNSLGTAEAIEADRERAVKDKLNGFGYTTGVGGMSKEKMMREKVAMLKKRSAVINEKYNRALVADITKLDGDQLSNFMLTCNFSDEFLYEADLYTIIEKIESKFKVYQAAIDTIPSVN